MTMFLSKEDQNHQQIAEFSELQNLYSSSSSSSSSLSMPRSPEDYGYFTDSLASTTSSPLHDTMDLFSTKEYFLQRENSLGDRESSCCDQDQSNHHQSKHLDEDIDFENSQLLNTIHDEFSTLQSNQLKDDIDFLGHKSNQHLDITQDQSAILASPGIRGSIQVKVIDEGNSNNDESEEEFSNFFKTNIMMKRVNDAEKSLISPLYNNNVERSCGKILPSKADELTLADESFSSKITNEGFVHHLINNEEKCSGDLLTQEKIILVDGLHSTSSIDFNLAKQGMIFYLFFFVN